MLNLSDFILHSSLALRGDRGIIGDIRFYIAVKRFDSNGRQRFDPDELFCRSQLQQVALVRAFIEVSIEALGNF